MANDKFPVIDNPWQALRRFTAARIALGRAGVSLPTSPLLAFQLAHAQARDAVHLALNADQLRQQLTDAGIEGAADCAIFDSAAGDRLTYLQRPDLGRRLSEASRAELASISAAEQPSSSRSSRSSAMVFTILPLSLPTAYRHWQLPGTQCPFWQACNSGLPHAAGSTRR